MEFVVDNCTRGRSWSSFGHCTHISHQTYNNSNTAFQSRAQTNHFTDGLLKNVSVFFFISSCQMGTVDLGKFVWANFLKSFYWFELKMFLLMKFHCYAQSLMNKDHCFIICRWRLFASLDLTTKSTKKKKKKRAPPPPKNINYPTAMSWHGCKLLTRRRKRLACSRLWINTWRLSIFFSFSKHIKYHMQQVPEKHNLEEILMPK